MIWSFLFGLLNPLPLAVIFWLLFRGSARKPSFGYGWIVLAACQDGTIPMQAIRGTATWPQIMASMAGTGISLVAALAYWSWWRQRTPGGAA